MINICVVPSATFGAGICSTTASRSGSTESVCFCQSSDIQLFFAEPYNTGKSNCHSSAPNSNIKSKTDSYTSSGVQFSLSTLLTTTMGLSFKLMAFCNTKRVCGIGPSKASTSNKTPSAIFKTRSTSPPKSACPGVSIILILVFLYWTETFLDRIVIPRSRSKSLLSRISSPLVSLSLKS
ncbi:MAG: Uncharacterised protein [Bacteroidota bacterium]|nr:MAG: Uncharacterised protein [Bacteroidota bacterium]